MQPERHRCQNPPSMECLPGRICHIQTHSLSSTYIDKVSWGEWRGRQGKGRGISSKATSPIGEWVLSHRGKGEAYSLTIMNIPTTPSQEAPIEMWEKCVFHLDIHHHPPIWVSWCQVRSELYLFDDFSYTFDIVTHNILSRPFGSLTQDKERKKAS